MKCSVNDIFIHKGTSRFRDSICSGKNRTASVKFCSHLCCSGCLQDPLPCWFVSQMWDAYWMWTGSDLGSRDQGWKPLTWWLGGSQKVTVVSEEGERNEGNQGQKVQTSCKHTLNCRSLFFFEHGMKVVKKWKRRERKVRVGRAGTNL